MIRVLEKNNIGFKKSVLQSVSMVYRSSRMDERLITSKNFVVYLSKRRFCFASPPRKVTGWKICVIFTNIAPWTWKASSMERVALAKRF